VQGSSDKPGYLPGYGAIPATTVREMAQPASLCGAERDRPCRRIPLPPRGSTDAVRAVSGFDRPHRALPVRADASVDQQAVLPNPKRAKGQSDGNLDQLLNAAFLASVVIEWA